MFTARGHCSSERVLAFRVITNSLLVADKQRNWSGSGCSWLVGHTVQFGALIEAENVWGSQGVHVRSDFTVAFCSMRWPAAHMRWVVQYADPVLFWYLPAGQVTHTINPASIVPENVPALQAWHRFAVMLTNWPGVHCMQNPADAAEHPCLSKPDAQEPHTEQLAAPPLDWNFDTGHCVHASWPDDDAKLPALHGSSIPCEVKWPARDDGMHAVWPSSIW